MVPYYPNLGCVIRGVCQAWCQEQGYSDAFCRNGEWWAYPPNGVMPVQIKTVMEKGSQRQVQLDSLTIFLFPDGSLAGETD